VFDVQDLEVRFVDDDDTLRDANMESLELEGIPARAFVDAEAALVGIDAGFRGVIVSDIRMPRIDGLELLGLIRAIDPEIPVLLITGHADVPTALSALRDGAFDFLTKPFAADHLIASVRRALDSRRLVLDNRRLREASVVAEESFPLIGESRVMRELRQTIVKVAQSDFDVLLEGETGTGKELVALLLHRGSPRRSRPFVAVNCGALDERQAQAELFGTIDGRGLLRPSRLEHIDRGTLFLDEIDSTRPEVQPKLLRLIEEREVLQPGADRPKLVDIRVIAAAKENLRGAVSEGRFRDDLFYRLDVIRLRMPPLRERRADIPLLFAHFLQAGAEKLGRPLPTIGAPVRAYLSDHDWPGNVRELRNFAHRCVIDVFEGRSDPARIDLSLPERLADFEARTLRDTLISVGGNTAEAAELLRIPRKTLYDKLARHDIDPSEFRAS
jgi:two-component system C4-dicarboxylate transport response regulator DctD